MVGPGDIQSLSDAATGGSGADVADQAPRRGLFARWLGRPARDVQGPAKEALVLAVASGKGGTGKSFLSTGLAVALSQRGQKATVVDCDFGMGNSHLLLGVNPKYTLQHYLTGHIPMEELHIQSPFGPGLIPAGSGVSSMTDLRGRDFIRLGQGMARLARTQDVLIFDTSAGLSAQAVATMLAADHVMLVTNPEIASLTDGYGVIKCLARSDACPTIHVVVNRVMEPGIGAQTFEKLAEVTRRFVDAEIHYLGEIPEDPAVTQRRLGQPPLVVSHPRCPVSKAIHGVIDQLEKARGPLGPSLVPARDALQARLPRSFKRTES